ncbi:SubName: Full=Uncharacterized protein {ECO:0000313/EMBL:CCA70137.1} [Serendipita indica DSM 11827]|uniref:Autophagy-related protein 27 n=1 Tax=Serendipita indica (strain DSM 11827) TaxID=1109443 RepID=G4TFQ6_SERID|nr:SubName: Full=Uncharacterized protein {ECO:0000313/EMBL:CCA70137.1} [Serendipita indica DSM 11827]CCA70137.1 hypothetical protein PIIN_04076 [Serendipita indica DSM 11827]
MDCVTEDNLAYFDLGDLKAQTDYVVESSLSANKFTLNVCQAVRTQLWNVDSVQEDQVAAYYRGKHGDFALGSIANSTLRVIDGDPVLYMGNGSPCPGLSDSKLRASAAVRFVCDSTLFNAGNPKLIAQFPGDDEHACAFSFEWKTPYACPSGRKPAGILHLLILFLTFVLIAVLVWLICLTLYNRFFLGLRGWDQFPSVPWLSPLRFFNWLHDKITGRGDGFVGGPGLRFGSSNGNTGWGSGGSTGRRFPKWRWGGWGRQSTRDGYGRLPEEEEGILDNDRASLDEGEEDATPRNMNGFDNAWANARSGGMSNDGIIRL